MLSGAVRVQHRKANLTVNIGNQFSKSISGSVVCFDNGITYTTVNVNYSRESIMEEDSTRADNRMGNAKKKGFVDFQIKVGGYGCGQTKI